MNKLIKVLPAAAIMAGIGVGFSQGQELAPSKVTGGGAFLDVGWWASEQSQPPRDPENPMGSGETVRFTVSIDPRGNAEVRANSPSLREFWGGPLVLSGPWEEWESDDPWMQDAKPAQQFKFSVTHPEHGDVAVWVFLNDNWTPGAVEDWGWADWVGIGVEPADGDGVLTYDPFGIHFDDVNDNLFCQVGPLVRGNIMDHRLPGASTGGHGKKKTPVLVE